ncbi:MAG: hypothetical protein H7145_11435 [Akkermansiaceae bacterium]|nr:hypothetical protein [Armatimonadota bacterium]
MCETGKCRSVILALYPNIETARDAAERLVTDEIPAGDLAVIVSEGKLRDVIERGVSFVPSSVFRGVGQDGAVEGAAWGGVAGIALGTEVLLLGVGTALAVPVLAGMALVGAVTGAALDATFREMDLDLEGTGYRMHLHHGGALLRVFARDRVTSQRIIATLRATFPAEIEHHPLAQ